MQYQGITLSFQRFYKTKQKYILHAIRKTQRKTVRMSVTLSVYISRVLMFEQRLDPGVNITVCVIQGWPSGAGSLRLVT